MSKHKILAAFLLALLALGCSKEEEVQDQKELDAILSRTPSVSVEMGKVGEIGDLTKRMDGENSRKILESLGATNRLAINNPKKWMVVSWVGFYVATNLLSRVEIFENDVLSYGHYYFKLKTPLDGKFIFTNAPFRLITDESHFERSSN